VNRLGTRLFLLIALAMVTATLAYDVFRLRREGGAHITQLEREVSLVARGLESPFHYWMETGRRAEELDTLLGDVRLALSALCVGVYDAEGTLVVASTAETAASRYCPEALELESELEGVLGRWSPAGTFQIVAPLTRGVSGTTTLALVLESTRITDPLRRQRNVIVVERALLLAAIGVVLWVVISLGVSRPIRRLMHGVEEIGHGRLETRIAVQTKTEIGALASAFNRMAENLRDAKQRSQAEEERRVSLERQLRHADKLAVIGKLASELAHEIGTPLNVISGRARLLRREFAEGDPRNENLEIIRTQVERISRVIRRFLDVGRAPRMQKETVDLATVVREMAAFVAPELRRKEVRLALAIPPALPTVTADPDGLSQVLLNLLMNALAAVPPGGRIGVALAPGEAPAEVVRRDGTQTGRLLAGVELRVTDDGHGIEAEILPRIFEPFFSTKAGEGTGLGLNICRDIVRDHDGEIGVESRPGEGTTVRVWLPTVSSEVSLASPESPDRRR
jgi:signal transduction histidine kinase